MTARTCARSPACRSRAQRDLRIDIAVEPDIVDHLCETHMAGLGRLALRRCCASEGGRAMLSPLGPPRATGSASHTACAPCRTSQGTMVASPPKETLAGGAELLDVAYEPKPEERGRRLVVSFDACRIAATVSSRVTWACMSSSCSLSATAWVPRAAVFPARRQVWRRSGNQCSLSRRQLSSFFVNAAGARGAGIAPQRSC